MHQWCSFSEYDAIECLHVALLRKGLIREMKMLVAHLQNHLASMLAEWWHEFSETLSLFNVASSLLRGYEWQPSSQVDLCWPPVTHTCTLTHTYTCTWTLLLCRNFTLMLRPKLCYTLVTFSSQIFETWSGTNMTCLSVSMKNQRSFSFFFLVEEPCADYRL